MKTFRAWIDERGSNEDRHHAICRIAKPDVRRRRCQHFRLVDLETNDYRIMVRAIRRWHPFYFSFAVFGRPHRGTVLLRIGRRL